MMTPRCLLLISSSIRVLAGVSSLLQSRAPSRINIYLRICLTFLIYQSINQWEKAYLAQLNKLRRPHPLWCNVEVTLFLSSAAPAKTLWWTTNSGRTGCPLASSVRQAAVRRRTRLQHQTKTVNKTSVWERRKRGCRLQTTWKQGRWTGAEPDLSDTRTCLAVITVLTVCTQKSVGPLCRSIKDQTANFSPLITGRPFFTSENMKHILCPTLPSGCDVFVSRNCLKIILLDAFKGSLTSCHYRFSVQKDRNIFLRIYELTACSAPTVLLLVSPCLISPSPPPPLCHACSSR